MLGKNQNVYKIMAKCQKIFHIIKHYEKSCHVFFLENFHINRVTINIIHLGDKFVFYSRKF